MSACERAREQGEQRARERAEQRAREQGEQRARERAEQRARERAEQRARERAEQRARERSVLARAFGEMWCERIARESAARTSEPPAVGDAREQDAR